MATDQSDPYLKYALFCKDTEEGDDGDLILKGIIDLIAVVSFLGVFAEQGVF